jgi:hypothetical protein
MNDTHISPSANLFSVAKELNLCIDVKGKKIAEGVI